MYKNLSYSFENFFFAYYKCVYLTKLCIHFQSTQGKFYNKNYYIIILLYYYVLKIIYYYI